MHSNLSSRRFLAGCAALILLSAVTTTLVAENWPSWRGPLSNGISAEKNVPTEWGAKKNVAWRLAMPGPAGATPVVWEDRIFVTSLDGTDLVLMCIGTDGKQLWKQIVGIGNKNVRGDEGNSASPSPATDGKHVWSMMANGAIACYDMDGKLVWKKNLQVDYGPFRIAFGMSATPVLHKERLFVQLIHGDGKAATQEAMVVALDKMTGKEIWKQDRVTKAHSENEHSYASPMLYSQGKTAYLITHGADYTIAYNLEDGSEVWRLGGLNPHDDPDRRYHPTLRFVASPAAGDGIVVVPTAKNGPVFAIRADSKGDITKSASARVWTRPANTPDVPSPLIHGGLVYLCRENGNLICMEQKTGKQIYEERTHRTRHRASPVYADGKIYLTARDGKITVVKAGTEFEILAQNEMGESIAASPAISNGTIYLRTFDALWAIREK